jgi:hypothetical protein
MGTYGLGGNHTQPDKDLQCQLIARASRLTGVLVVKKVRQSFPLSRLPTRSLFQVVMIFDEFESARRKLIPRLLDERSALRFSRRNPLPVVARVLLVSDVLKGLAESSWEKVNVVEAANAYCQLLRLVTAAWFRLVLLAERESRMLIEGGRDERKADEHQTVPKLRILGRQRFLTQSWILAQQRFVDFLTLRAAEIPPAVLSRIVISLDSFVERCTASSSSQLLMLSGQSEDVGVPRKLLGFVDAVTGRLKDVSNELDFHSTVDCLIAVFRLPIAAKEEVSQALLEQIYVYLVEDLSKAEAEHREINRKLKGEGRSPEELDKHHRFLGSTQRRREERLRYLTDKLRPGELVVLHTALEKVATRRGGLTGKSTTPVLGVTGHRSLVPRGSKHDSKLTTHEKVLTIQRMVRNALLAPGKMKHLKFQHRLELLRALTASNAQDSEFLRVLLEAVQEYIVRDDASMKSSELSLLLGLLGELHSREVSGKVRQLMVSVGRGVLKILTPFLDRLSQESAKQVEAGVTQLRLVPGGPTLSLINSRARGMKTIVA